MDWCLLRGRDHLEAPTGDVDILVAPAHVAELDDVVRAHGFVRLRCWLNGTQRAYVGPAVGSVPWVALHVVTELSFGTMHAMPLPSGVAAGVLGRSIVDRGVPVAASTDELWITLLHCWFDKGRIAEKHRQRLPELVDTDAVVLPAEVRSLLPPRVLGLVGERRWEEVEAFGADTARRQLRRPRVRARWALNAASLSAHKLAELFGAPAPSVALIAPDGAGKSTVSAALGDALWFGVHVEYLGLYGSAMKQPAASRFGLGFPQRLLRLWARGLRGHWRRMRGNLVVYDRHPIEPSLEPPRSWRRAGARALLRRALPRPSLVIVLDAPGAVLHERSGEHTPEVLERARLRYRHAFEGQPGVVFVDAARSIDDVLAEVRAHIWGLYVARDRRGSTGNES